MTAPESPPARLARRPSLAGPLAWMRAHALISFFALAYAFSWAVWLVEVAVESAEPLIARWLGLILPYGPFVAAALMTALLPPAHPSATEASARAESSSGSRIRMLLVPLPVLLASAASILLPQPIDGSRTSQPGLAALALGIVLLLPAAAMAMAHSPVRGWRAWLGSLVQPRGAWGWLALALVFMPIASALGLGLIALFGGGVPDMPRTEAPAQLVPLLLAAFAGTLFYGGPLGEEPGWRGFALPRLQERFSPLVASIVLGVLWGAWHFPLHVAGPTASAYASDIGPGVMGLVMRVATGVGLSLLFTWFYNRSRGSLAVSVVLHTAVNNTAGFWLPVNSGVFVVIAVFMIALGVRDHMERRLLPR